MASISNPTVGEGLLLLYGIVIGGCVMWWYLFKGLMALWIKTKGR